MEDKNEYSIKEKLKRKYKDNIFLPISKNIKNNELMKIYIYYKYDNISKEQKKRNNIYRLIRIYINEKIIKLILIMNVINEIISQIMHQKKILLNSSEILLKINEIGMNNILYKNYLNKEFPCPSFIYLNDEIQNLTECYKINITKPESLVKLIWINPLKTIHGLFLFCSNITEVKFLNFDTSLINNITGVFQHCTSLTSVDVSSLNIKNVSYIHFMFDNCSSIKYIDLSNFDTSSTTEMNRMFQNCTSLTSINLSHFDTSKVGYMNHLFYNCKDLEYINLFNFTDNKSLTIQDMFTGIKKNAVICIDKNKAPSIYNLADNMPCVSISCRPDWQNVQYKLSETGDCIINCSSTINRYEYQGKCYDNCPDDTILYKNKCYLNHELCDSNCKTCYIEDNIPSSNCSSCYGNKYLKNGNCVDNCENEYYYHNINDNVFYCTLNNLCPKDFSKLIPEKNQCIDDCRKDPYYQYEFRNICYQECPYNISIKSETKNFYCEVKCSLEYPFEIIETQNCVKSCSITDIERGICKINYISDNGDNLEKEEKVLENIKEKLTNDFETSELDQGKNIIIEQKDSIITITTTENQKNDESINSTTINLGECENKIKKEYCIPDNKSLYILKIDVKQKGLKILKIVYEVYYPLFGDNLIKLNLTVCEDTKIEI